MRAKPHPERVSRIKLPRSIWLLILCTALCEIILWGSDQGYWGAQFWRLQSYQYGAFWPGLLGNWQPNYALQPYIMWVSYAFLHGGLSHMIGNMLALIIFSNRLLDDVTERTVFTIYFASAIGGAAVFAMINGGFQPMVGASGALFGLLGAIITTDFASAHYTRKARITALRQILFLIAINIIMWLWLDGLLAWETHMGGFLAGAGLGWWSMSHKGQR